MSCGVGCSHGSNLALLWLWRNPAAVAPIPPLAWEPPYATDVSLKRPKKKKKSMGWGDQWGKDWGWATKRPPGFVISTVWMWSLQPHRGIHQLSDVFFTII